MDTCSPWCAGAFGAPYASHLQRTASKREITEWCGPLSVIRERFFLDLGQLLLAVGEAGRADILWRARKSQSAYPDPVHSLGQGTLLPIWNQVQNWASVISKGGRWTLRRYLDSSGCVRISLLFRRLNSGNDPWLCCRQEIGRCHGTR